MARIWLLLGLLLAVSACSGLAGEPEIVGELPTARPTQVVVPQTAPDLTQGAQIFAARCITCHGPEGRGDGELIGEGEGQIAFRPPDFTDPATTADMSANGWYQVIRDGRIERLMPPWGNALSETELWAVTFYTYTMHDQGADLALGESIYAQQSGGQPLTMTELVTLTDAQIVQRLAPNVSLPDDQQRALVAYARSQALTVPPVATPEVVSGDTTTGTEDTTPVTLGLVGGTVTNGTAGAGIPIGAVVVLTTYDNQFTEQERQTTVNPDGTYLFNEVPLREDYSYSVSVRYNGRLFSSDFQHGATGTTLELPVMVYERTTDPSVIEISAVISQVMLFEDGAQIVQTIAYRNTSDRMFSSDEMIDQDVYTSVRVALPAGAQFLGSPTGERRYVLSDDLTAVVDTVPVLPGEQHTQQLVFGVMLSDGRATVEQTLPYPLNGEYRLLVTPPDARVTTELNAQGPQQIRDIAYLTYGAPLILGSGSTLTFSVQPPAQPLIPDNLVVPAGLIGSGTLLLIVAGVLFLRMRKDEKGVSKK